VGRVSRQDTEKGSHVWCFEKSLATQYGTPDASLNVGRPDIGIAYFSVAQLMSSYPMSIGTAQ
jgi:hypothetical protein